MNRTKIGTIAVDTASLYIGDPCYIQEHWIKQGEEIGIRFWGADAHHLVDAFPVRLVEGKSPHYLLLYEDLPEDEFLLQLSTFLQKFEASFDRKPMIMDSFEKTSTLQAVYRALDAREEGHGVIYRERFHPKTTLTFPMGAAFQLRADGGYDVYEVRSEDGRLLKIEIEVEA